ncbi:hypothetical protein [Budvicia aquatica]|uniref:Uncharacterized protein n=1 Tax=Budvicia aquatica TaxID=82979 RepID=A0A2C6DQA8_9GAMM|nr:hypothetical protein [Budvicia aquatica]PHI30873.1 hypothetical protein CRN84_16785 [Budvicia aquatica]VFS50727.1 Uncharacterised protein [Budvicia aquatica]
MTATRTERYQIIFYDETEKRVKDEYDYEIDFQIDGAVSPALVASLRLLIVGPEDNPCYWGSNLKTHPNMVMPSGYYIFDIAKLDAEQLVSQIMTVLDADWEREREHISG